MATITVLGVIAVVATAIISAASKTSKLDSHKNNFSLEGESLIFN